MSAGEHLDAAAAGIAQAHALIRQSGPASGAEQASAALARIRLYRELERQTTLLTGASLPSDLATATAASDAAASPVVGLLAGLRRTSELTQAKMPIQSLSVERVGAVATTMLRAADRIGAANDLIAGNLGAARARPPTPEGLALAHGIGQHDNLALTGRLVRGVVDLDAALHRGRWLTPGSDAGVWRPLLMLAAADCKRTIHSSLRIHAVNVLDGRSDATASIRAVNGVSSDDPSVWAAIDSHRGAVAGVDAARSWLLDNSDQVTAGQVAAAARAAMAITRYAGHVLRVTNPSEPVTLAATRAAHWWRVTAAEVGNLRSPVIPASDHSVLTASMTGVARWLGEQLRPEGQWAPNRQWAQRPRQREAWRRTSGELMVRLPHLSQLLWEAVRRVQRQGMLLGPETRGAAPGSPKPVMRWKPVSERDSCFAELQVALYNARQCSSWLARVAGMPLPPRIPAPTSTPTHLAGPAPHRAGLSHTPARPVRGVGASR
ncbi:hypothetical protein [Polymorphospora sp. NPDC050346]|uniref:hypothetical protein n=1 Tax=Polymorphospora sp. NPDC050346 TaxID=3155780 RepID=UPI0033D9EF54